jgi:hypothetical protein
MEMIISPTKKIVEAMKEIVDLTKTGVLMTEMIFSAAKNIVSVAETIFAVAKTIVFVTHIILAEAKKILPMANKMLFVPSTMVCARTPVHRGVSGSASAVDRPLPTTSWFIFGELQPARAGTRFGKARDEIGARFSAPRTSPG